jgi:hypothetical protein
MNFMPGGSFFGAMWFGLLFLAAVTSSLSMLQPAIAFLEDGFGLKRRASVALLGVITAIGATGTMYFSRNALALDHTDFWCNLMMIIAATCQVLLFGWIMGAERGVREMNRGADLQVPRFIAIVIRFITPAFLLIVLVMWAYTHGPDYWHGMDPERQGALAKRGVYVDTVGDHFADEELSDEQLTQRIEGVLGPEGAPVDETLLPDWLASVTVEVTEDKSLPIAEFAAETASKAATDAKIARFVFLGILAFFILLVALSDIACRNRIGRTIEDAERAGLDSEVTT